MKNIVRYLNVATLLIALTTLFAACSDKDDNDGGNLGLNIKVFSPTVVIPGTSMSINGSCLGDVQEIIFPGDITVTDFEIVTDEMIRVKAPAGLSQAGTIKVRNSAGEVAESRLPLSIGKTNVTGYSAQEGDLLKGNETLTVYGKDMQFITSAEFIDADGNPIVVPASEFVRVATGRVVIQVPSNVLTGKSTVKIYSESLVFESPEFEFETATSGGHWEYVKRYLWQNDGSNGAVSWNGVYRFSNVEKSSGEEIYAFSMEDWALIKDDVVYLLFDGNASSNVRITTGWWTGAYGGAEHNSIDFAEVDEETGMMSIALNIKEDGNLYDNLDDQHLLFTGDAYTPMAIYVVDAVWVGGDGHFETVRTSFWKNGEQSTIPAPNWSGEGRFARASSSSGEETYAFTDEQWEILKTQPFRVAIEKTEENPNVRITTGWWSSDYGGKDFNCYEFAEVDEDGTIFIELNLANYPELLELVDVQHLLFTGTGYRLLEIYQQEDVWVDDGGDDSTPIILWQNDGSNGAVSWNGVYRFSNVETKSGEEIYAFSMEDWSIIKDGTFYVEFEGSSNSNVRITTGWWSGAYGGEEHNCMDFAIEDADTGHYLIEVNIKQDGNLYDNVDAQHFLLTGDAYTPLKLFYYKKK